MKITEQTTLGEIEMERVRLGVTRLLVILNPGEISQSPNNGLDAIVPWKQLVQVCLVTQDGSINETALSIPEALEAAFSRREDQIGRFVAEAQGTP